jgi:hypothetical protein
MEGQGFGSFPDHPEPRVIARLDVFVAEGVQKLSQEGKGESVSVSEFARRAGCDRKQVQRAIKKGLLSPEPDGKILASLVGGQWRKPNRRTIAKRAELAGGTTQVAPPEKNVSPRRTGSRKAETPAEVAERLVAQHPLLSLDEALKLKENYLGRLKQLDYDLKAGTVHLSSNCVKAVGQEYARVRTKVLAVPSEQAPALFRCRSVAEIEDLLRGVLVEALEALTLDHEPAAA